MIASGKCVDLHIIVSRYWLPDLVLGRGPMQSIIVSLNGLLQAGMGLRGATGIVFRPSGTHDRICSIQKCLF